MIVGQGYRRWRSASRWASRARSRIGRVIAGLLFDVGARDPLVIMPASPRSSAVAGVVASAVAARQGISIDPAAALRDE